MKTILLLATTMLVATNAFADDAPAQTTRSKIAPFEPRLTTLRGGSLQPSVGLQASSALQPATGIRQNSEGIVVSGLTSDEEWRRLFPKKYGER